MPTAGTCDRLLRSAQNSCDLNQRKNSHLSKDRGYQPSRHGVCEGGVIEKGRACGCGRSVRNIWRAHGVFRAEPSCGFPRPRPSTSPLQRYTCAGFSLVWPGRQTASGAAMGVTGRKVCTGVGRNIRLRGSPLNLQRSANSFVWRHYLNLARELTTLSDRHAARHATWRWHFQDLKAVGWGG
jgi:hypothetical protein